MPMTVVPFSSKHMTGPFDLYSALLGSLEAGREDLRNGDVLVVSSKYASISEGRVLDLDRVRASDAGMRLSARYALRPETAEVILRLPRLRRSPRSTSRWLRRPVAARVQPPLPPHLDA